MTQPIKGGSVLTPEARAFLQRRVAAFGWVGAAMGGLFLVLRIAVCLVIGEPALLLEPSMVFHLLGVLATLVPWLLARGPARSPGFVQTLELAGLFLAATFYLLMGGHLASTSGASSSDAALMMTILILTYIMLARAVFVPSTGRRSLLVTGIVVLPMIATALWVKGQEPVPPELRITPAQAVALEVLFTVAWWTITTGLCVLTSRVIYGLRSEARAARQLGQYTLAEKIGEGGMGAVYRAHHGLLRRPTAIKLVRGDVVDERTLARFEREVQLSARLSHPNTITVFDYGRTPDGVFYYAMELLDGADLGAVVEVDGPQPPGRVLHVLEQVAGALQEAHGIGLIHRDVKPGNIILCSRGGVPDVAKVVDFGLVKDLEHVGGELTRDDILTGTPLYLAPEAIRSPEGVDASADVYALGAVGYFLLTGGHVFSGRTVVEVCSHHLSTPPEPPSERLGSVVPEDLERLLLACLEKDPGRRPASAAELRAAVRACGDMGRWSEELGRRWWTGHASALEARREAHRVSETGRTLAVRRAPTAS